MNNIEILKLILQMYRFEQPIPDSVKIQMIHSMRKNLIIILKQFGKYSFFTAVAVYVFFIFKKIGLSISLFKTYILLFATSVLVTGAISVVTYTVIKKHFDAVAYVKEAEMSCISEDNKRQQPKRFIQVAQNYKLEMYPFAGSRSSASDSDKVTNTIFKYMKKYLKDAVVLSESNHGTESPYMMVGSILRLGNTNKINARLVDARNSMVLMYISEDWAGDDDLGSIAEKIAYAFAQKIE